MELFIPGLLVIVISAFVAFLVIPRFGPMILGVVSLLALIAAGVHHWTMFHSEYKLSTWQNGIAAYGSWVILGLAIMAIIAAIFSYFTGESYSITSPIEKIQDAVSNSVNIMPMANTATNSFTASLNKGINSFRKI